jgi:hypothetical protein
MRRTITMQHVAVGSVLGVATGYYIFDPIIRETM